VVNPASIDFSPTAASSPRDLQSAAADFNALIMLDEGTRNYPPGQVVEVLPYT